MALTAAEVVTLASAWLDTKAQARLHRDIDAACIFAATDNKFRDEGVNWLTLKADVREYLFEQLELIQAGQRSMPESAVEFLAELDSVFVIGF